jgi:hypothetical protein
MDCKTQTVQQRKLGCVIIVVFVEILEVMTSQLIEVLYAECLRLFFQLHVV